MQHSLPYHSACHRAQLLPAITCRYIDMQAQECAVCWCHRQQEQETVATPKRRARVLSNAPQYVNPNHSQQLALPLPLLLLSKLRATKERPQPERCAHVFSSVREPGECGCVYCARRQQPKELY